MRQFTARNSGINYEGEFNINLNTLGCVMLDLEVEDLTSLIPKGLIPYVSPDPDQFWINGVTDPDEMHITLRYGLMPFVRMRHCETVLRNSQVEDIFDYYPASYDETWTLPYRLNTFEGFNGEYFVLVVELDINYDDSPPAAISDYVQMCHDALGTLPNLATFSPPTFHMTLGYFAMPEGDDVPSFANVRGTVGVKIKGIRYGKHMQP